MPPLDPEPDAPYGLVGGVLGDCACLGVDADGPGAVIKALFAPEEAGGGVVASGVASLGSKGTSTTSPVGWGALGGLAWGLGDEGCGAASSSETRSSKSVSFSRIIYMSSP